jgi:hypothetical protein
VNLATKLKKNKIRNLNVVRTSSLWAGFPTKVSISKRAQLDHTYLEKKSSLEDFYVSIATLHANLMVQELLDLD